MKIDFISIIVFFAAIVNFLFGFHALKKKRRTNFNFACIAYSVVAWCLTMIIYRGLKTSQASIWAAQFLYLSAVFISYSFLLFTFVFPGQRKGLHFLAKFLIFLPFLLTALATLTPGLVIKDVIIIPGSEKVIIFGPAYYWLYLFYIPTYFGLGFVNLIITYFKYGGMARAQTSYILAGSLISSSLGMVTNLILPTFSIFTFNWLGQILTVVFIGCITYTIIRYRFLDIRLVIKRSTIFFVSLASVFAIFGLAYYLIWQLAPSVLINQGTALSFATLGLGIFLFLPLRNLFRKLGDKLIFADIFTYQTALQDLSFRLTSIIKLTEIVDSILYAMIRVMRLERAGILLKDEKNVFRVKKVIGFDPNNGVSLVKDDFFTQYLAKQQRPVVKEELRVKAQEEVDPIKKKKLKEVVSQLINIKASLVLPLLVHNELIGLVVLGPKEGSSTYTHEDLNLLSTLTNQAAIAIENAKLYNYMEDIVAYRTKELVKQTQVLKKTNKQLIELSKVKSEFLTIASHQLRTPLSAAWGFLSMLKDGTLDKESESEKKKIYAMIYESVSRLNNIVNDLLDAMEADNQRLKITKTNINLNQLIQDSIFQALPQAKEKNITFNFKPNPKLPTIQADSKYLPEVIRNLIDNAIKYTPKKKIKSSVAITTKQDNQFLTLSIQDQGVGIPKADIPKLFTQFQRASNARKVHTDGSGLGLYIAKKVLEAHQGSISIISPGLNQGTTVTVRLPLKQELRRMGEEG